jgi:hypothetical protein
LLTLDLWIEQVIYPWIRGLLSQTYFGNSPPWILTTFQHFAQDAYKTPLDLYLTKVDRFNFWARIPLSIVIVGVPMCYGFRLHSSTFKRKIRKVLRQWGPLTLAAALLGVTISMRLVGLLAGTIISMVFLWKDRKRAILPLTL